MLDDKIEKLEELFKKQIEEIKEYNHEQLIARCESENLECDGLDDEEIRKALIEYYSEGIDDED